MKITRVCGRKLLGLLFVIGLVCGLMGGIASAGTHRVERLTVPQVGGGEYHSLLRKADGSIWGWGNNDSGHLGVGDNSQRPSPVRVGSASGLVTVSAGNYHTLALHIDGSLWAWGNNDSGQLGLGDTNNRPSPVRVGRGTNWIAVSAGSAHTLALEADGSLWAWGNNDSGQLGLRDMNNRSIPVQVGRAANWVAVSAGKAHSLALKADGSLWGWGNNNNGQLGLGNFIQHESPVQVGSATDWVAVSAGGYHTLALKADGSLWTWGWNAHGQLGFETPNRRRPVQVGSATDWVAVSAGKAHSLALKTDGSLWAWGMNNNGQLGLGDTNNSLSPVRAGNDTDWVAVSAGGFHTLALKADGSLWAWGMNNNGQLGLGDNAQRNIPTQVEAAGHLTLGLNPERHDFGPIPRGLVGVSQIFTLTNDANQNFLITNIGVRGPYEMSNTCPAALAAGSSCTVTVTLESNLSGNLPGALVIHSPSVITGVVTVHLTAKVETPSAPRIEGSGHHSVLQKADGSFWAWGNNSRGQLGLGDNDNRTTPVQVGSATRWVTVSAREHNLAIKADGSLWAWGLNWYGQLGLGHSNQLTRPEQVGTDTDWVTVSAGGWHTLAIKADGSLYAWGRNNYGQLGLGDTTRRPRPEQVGTDTDWVAVSAGVWHTLALKADGSLYAWGRNNYGQLGQGDTANRLRPARLAAAHWEEIVAGYDHSLAIKVDGTLWAWGDNAFGQLGLGHNDRRAIPERVGNDADWEAVITGYDHTLAFKADGSLWAWGKNAFGQLGLGQGDTANRSSPEQVDSAAEWLAVSAGDHTLALKADGTLHAWGRNYEGQLGQGDTVSRTIPTQIDADNHIPLQLNAFSQDFGILNRGASGVNKTFMLTNEHEDRDLLINGIGARGPYEVHNTCPSALAAGTSCTITINLRTSSAGDFRGSLAIWTPGVYTGEVTIPLAAGITGPRLKIDHPGPFFTIPVGVTARTHVILTNSGSESLVINSVTPYGNSAFDVNNNCPGILPSGGSCTLGVSFSPFAYGKFAGGVEIDSNDPVKPLRKLGFRGTGEATTRLESSGIATTGEVKGKEKRPMR